MTTNNIKYLPKDITEQFICPICKHNTVLEPSQVICLNDECKSCFPVTNGIPVLINESESIFNIDDFLTYPNQEKRENPGSISIFFREIFPTLSNNLSSKENFRKLKELLSEIESPKILIVGGATITTDTEQIFNEKNIIVESDIYFGPRTQIILDAHNIPFKDNTFDLIIFQAVLEHVADPYTCVNEAHRVLKDTGIIFAATPFMQQVHMKAFDFTRFTHLGHRRLFRKYKEIDSGISAGSGVALAWSIKYFLFSLSNQKSLRFIFKMISSVLFFWLKYVDLITKNNKGSYDGASAFYFIGQKSHEVLTDKQLIKQFRGFNY